MKNTLRILLLSLGAAALVLPAVRAQDDAKPAQEHRERGGGGPGKMFERLAKELNLTEDQRAQWKAIGEKEKAALDAIPKEERREKGRELNKTYADQRRAVLTPEQQTKFDDLMKKMRERRGPGGPGKGEGHDAPPPPPADAK